ncbi:MAG: carbohydrate ABC transporter permease [Opitutales bacterium]
MHGSSSSPAELFKKGVILFVLAFAFLPLYVMIVVSFKSNAQYQRNPWFFDPIGEWHWQNWAVAWETVQVYIYNSVFTSVTGTAITTVMVILTSYVLARYRFPGRSVFYYLILASMFLPGTAASLVAVFSLLKGLNLINSLWALVLVFAASGQVVGVFILKQFIEDIPKELFESVQIDGGGHLAQIRHVVLPMSGSIIGVTVIMDFLNSWNQVILPLIVLRDDELLTIPVGLLRMEGEYVKNYGELMAGYTISSLPLVVLFIFCTRFFVKGLAGGAIKG